MEYRGYIGEVVFDDSTGMLHGTVLNTRDVITFETGMADQVEREFHIAIDDYIKSCAEDGVEPEKPYSGDLRVRLGTDLHRTLALEAARVKVSLNALIKERLMESLSQ